MERGVPFRFEVLDPGDVDGIAVESFDVYSEVREIVPTVGGVPLRAGPMPYVIEPMDPDATCEIDARDWGEPPVEGADTPPATWGVRLTGEPCELRITLPAAARGAGLEDVIAWPT
jgi:hypothetical protein